MKIFSLLLLLFIISGCSSIEKIEKLPIPNILDILKGGGEPEQNQYQTIIITRDAAVSDIVCTPKTSGNLNITIIDDKN